MPTTRLSPQRQRYSTPPPQRTTSPKQLTSPTKSFDSGHKRLQSMIHLRSTACRLERYKYRILRHYLPIIVLRHHEKTTTTTTTRSPVLGAYGSFNKVDTHGNVVGTDQKSEAYERASKLLQRVDASKVAAEKVEKAREAARLAMEKAKKAKAAKLQQQQQGKTTRLCDLPTRCESTRFPVKIHLQVSVFLATARVSQRQSKNTIIHYSLTRIR